MPRKKKKSPADETTYTKSNLHYNEVHGFLSHIFPGPVGFPRLDAVPHSQTIRSRLCEVIWLEPSLFDLPEDGQVILLFEESYPEISKLLGCRVTAGSLGEQIVVRHIDPQRLKPGVTVKIGDAKLEVISPRNHPRSTSHSAYSDL